MVRIAGVLVALVLLPACEPRSSVQVRGHDANLVLTFTNCADALQALPLKGLVIRLEGSQTPHCELRWRDRAQPHLGPTWSYGTTVPGYDLVGCGTLERGARYQIVAQTGPSQARATFAIAADGTTSNAGGGCP